VKKKDATRARTYTALPSPDTGPQVDGKLLSLMICSAGGGEGANTCAGTGGGADTDGGGSKGTDAGGGVGGNTGASAGGGVWMLAEVWKPSSMRETTSAE
jgi:hypothetical protein